MVTKHHKAETKMILIIRNVHLQNVLSTLFHLGSNHIEIFSKEVQHRLKTLANLDTYNIETINYLPPVQQYSSFAWDHMVQEYQWTVTLVKNKTISMQ